MAISRDEATPTRTGSATASSDLLRRRPTATATATPGAVPKSPARATSGGFFGEESSVGSSSDGEVCHRVGGGDGRVDEEERRSMTSNDKEHEDGITRGKGPATDGEVRAMFLYRASAPAHQRIKESPLSSDAIFKQSHAGLLNLCIVVLIAVNGRLIIENLMKYGLLIQAGFWFSSKSLRDWPLLMCCFTLSLFPLAAFLIEKLAWRKLISEPLVITFHAIITTSAILYPAFIILRCDSSVLSGFVLMFIASIVWLKLVSYAHTNYDIRMLSQNIHKEDKSYNFPDLSIKEGVSFNQLAYFMFAPTLCYQQNYPRTMAIRKGWVTRQLIKWVICTGVMGFIIEQYMNPIVNQSRHPLKVNLLYAIEGVLKLSVPTLYVWLCMFYGFFHLWLNILAELLRFGDREFYRDWWNAKTVEEYWRMWNMPVHKWMIRHVYSPCLRNGIPKGVSFFISFFVSAIFHELCVAVPCHIFKFWAFLGIMFQIPLVTLTKYLQSKFTNTMVGNIVFWFFFCILGQPMCVLLYYHDVMNRNLKD
ncbi:diacylglycerol O-acyltransferase 1-2-like [Curcuma longa]|uniref:diacylglycerol O-acyltransferase 1-2-like n=1 Tax=Curcuma longa TaxID=136217 RepID=UPI003D9E4037